MMILHDVPQRSPEWFALRAGKLTGSVAADILATLKKGGEPAGRRDLRLKLAIERVTGQPLDMNGYVNDAMQHGIDTEDAARREYEIETGEMVRQVGFVTHDHLLAGCSPDGLVGTEGVLEIKCPKSSTHLGYLKAGVVPDDYIPQLIHNLWITGAQWADFVSFDDRFTGELAKLRFFRIRLLRDEKQIATYALAAQTFLNEVEAEVSGLKTLADPFRRFEVA